MTELRKLRKAKGLTQTELAARVNILVSRYNMIESGRRPAPPLVAQRIAEQLDTETEALFLPGSFTVREIKDCANG